MAQRRKRNNTRDIEELESTYRNLSRSANRRTGRYATKKTFTAGKLLTIILVLVLIAGAVAGCFALKDLFNARTVNANLTIAGLNLSGMTRQEAIDAVAEHFNALYADKDLTVVIQDESYTIPYSVSKVSIDAERAVDKALSYGAFSTTVTALDVVDCISIDKDAVNELLAPLPGHFSAKLIQTTYCFTGVKPESFDKIDENASITLEITKGQPGTRLDLSMLVSDIMHCYNDGNLEMSFTCPYTEPDPVDWKAVSELNTVLPVDAVMDEKTFEISGGTYGYGFTAEAAEQAFNNAAYGETVKVPLEWTAPNYTAEELGAVLFKDVLATYTTKASSDYARNINLKVAAAAVNGTILYPGDTFSFNRTVGERTKEKGYQLGASYVAGETVYDYGGGVCQVATTIYYCSVISDLQIVERYPHGYASAYTPLSTDATVFWPSVDFKFKNTTDYPIRIEASTNKGHVTVSLIGTDTKDYYVKFEYKHLETIPFEVVYEEMEADNEKGYKDGDVITTPYTGYKSESYRAKYDKVTGKLISRTLECSDTYFARNKVICKIINPEEPTTEPTVPVDPTEPPTQPPTDPVVTIPPETDPPETEPPVVTDPPVTEPPTTLPPATLPPEPEVPAPEEEQ